MFKDEYKKMNESIRPGSGLIERTERSMAEIMNKKDAKRMSAKMAVALAMACVLALTGVAFATGAIQSVFSWMGQRYANQKVDYEMLDQLADRDMGMGEMDSENAGTVSVELNQVYYDGTQLIVGSRYAVGTTKVVHGLDHELMVMTKVGDPAFSATRHALVNDEIYLDADEAIDQKSKMLPAYVTANVEQADVAAFEEEYRKNGEAGMVIYEAFVSDHIELEGEVLIDTVPEKDLGRMQEDGRVWRYAEFINLPNGVRNQDNINVIFGINQKAMIIRADKDGVWIAQKGLEKIRFPFGVENNGQETSIYYGSFENEIYSADAEVRRSEVVDRIAINLNHPAEWYKEDMDYIMAYHVVYSDGTTDDIWNGVDPTGENSRRVTGVIEVKEGQTEIILRPEYTKSGLREGEDIVISLENGISSVK